MVCSFSAKALFNASSLDFNGLIIRPERVGKYQTQYGQPDQKRSREFLEQYSLDTLRMVGTLRLSGQMYGLVETKDGLVHRVTTGNHMGQAEGKITEITPAKISLVEIVPDSLGGYMERPAALALNE